MRLFPRRATGAAGTPASAPWSGAPPVFAASALPCVSTKADAVAGASTADAAGPPPPLPVGAGTSAAAAVAAVVPGPTLAAPTPTPRPTSPCPDAAATVASATAVAVLASTVAIADPPPEGWCYKERAGRKNSGDARRSRRIGRCFTEWAALSPSAETIYSLNYFDDSSVPRRGKLKG